MFNAGTIEGEMMHYVGPIGSNSNQFLRMVELVLVISITSFLCLFVKVIGVLEYESIDFGLKFMNIYFIDGCNVSSKKAGHGCNYLTKHQIFI